MSTEPAQHEAGILQEFAAKMLANTKELDADVAAALNERFWELYEPIP